ncbi:MAG: thiamine-monophosphate kinase [Deltaproteobacteria bacterium]|nr:thiamine-monophosphate kinase [Deltaproteobacteria bacterium]
MSLRVRPPRTIAEVGEFGFLARLLPRLPGARDLIVGPGQDCAVISTRRGAWLITVDALVEHVHFERAWLSPRQLGRKSFLVNASDIAAMGGRPRFCVVSLGVPRTYLARDLRALQAGIVAAAADCGASIVGGNLARADTLFVSIALLGNAPGRIVTRQGARTGDLIFVTGTLGDAALGLRWLRGRTGPGKSAHSIRRFRLPSPRLQAGRLLVSRGLASSMVDVSDGLVQDLGHICTESRVGAEIQTESIPRSAAYRAAMGTDPALALRGGEDYELLCTVPERHVKTLQRLAPQLGCPLTCIGRITPGSGIGLRTSDGRTLSVQGGGYDHFRRS